MYEYEYKGFSGGGSQFASILKMAPSPGNHEPLKNTRAVVSYTWAPNAPGNRGGYIPNKGKMSYSRSYKSYSKPLKLPALGGLLNIALIGVAVYVVYKIYSSISGGLGSLGNLFGFNAQSSAAAAATTKGDTALAATYVPTTQAKADTLTATASSLSSLGYTVSSLHKGIADDLHLWMDSVWVDHDQIVNTILQEDIQTFQLVSVAYGTRELTVYIDAHPLSGGWSLANLFSLSNKQIGTLKDHLLLVLSSDEITKLHDYIAAI